jgi:hypothetical protein
MRRQLCLLTLLLVALGAGWSWLGAGEFSGRALAATKAPQRNSPRHRQPPPSEVTLPHNFAGAPSAAVTMIPVGLSLEYPLMAQYLEGSACPSPALAEELRRLGSPPLALAGLTQDLTAPSGTLPNPPPSWEIGRLYSLPADFWSRLHCLLSVAGDPLTAGINARTGQLSWAAQIVAGAQSAATNGLDFSLGNEPDLYHLLNYGSVATPPSNEESAAVSLYLQVATYLQQAVGGGGVIGPELAGAAHWQHRLPQVISALHEHAVGVHLYPLTACSQSAATTEALLSASAANAPRSLAWVVADARAAGIPALLSEANSASCGGRAGVSDTPAAAVWAVRFVISALITGFREVRFHFSGGPYDPFVVRGEEVIRRPLETALAALNQWLPSGVSLQPLSHIRGLRATAVQGPAGTPALILDNENTRAQAVVLRGEQTIRVQELNAALAGLHPEQLTSPSARIRMVLPPNSVMAVFSSP